MSRFRGFLGQTGVLLAAAATAAAQGGNPANMEEEIRKKMEEISHLMRDSERRLLEMTNVDRIVEQQEEIVRRIEELLPPESAQEQAADMTKRREELEQRQRELVEKIDEMLKQQQAASDRTVEQIRELLRNLPRQSQEGQGHEDDKKPRPRSEEEKRLQEEKEKQDRKQEDREQQRRPDQKKRDQLRTGEKPASETAEAAQRRVAAWIARLPPEELAKINRNDFSSIPLRYRKLVQEYTALRAKREAEEQDER